jgi:hypothetical protein
MANDWGRLDASQKKAAHLRGRQCFKIEGGEITSRTAGMSDAG